MGKNTAVYDMMELIKATFDDKYSDKDQTILGKVTAVNTDGTLDLAILPDTTTTIGSIVNASKYTFFLGDYAIVYKIGNRLANAFVLAKLNPAASDLINHSDSVVTTVNVDSVETATNAINIKAYDNTFKSLAVAMLEMVYPVGSIYMTTTALTEVADHPEKSGPATFLGGKWVRWGQGQVPVGVDSTDSSFNTVEAVGGSKDAVVVQHTHLMQESGAHQHVTTIPQYTNSGSEDNYAVVDRDNCARGNYYSNESGAHTHTINSTGVVATNKNLQPYVTCYMWKRVSDDYGWKTVSTVDTTLYTDSETVEASSSQTVSNTIYNSAISNVNWYLPAQVSGTATFTESKSGSTTTHSYTFTDVELTANQSVSIVNGAVGALSSISIYGCRNPRTAQLEISNILRNDNLSDEITLTVEFHITTVKQCY